MRLYVGTSGWVYKDWVKKFYPKDLRDKGKLKYYAKYFKTVENNSSFYRLPSVSAVQNWYLQTPKGFSFSVKLSRYVTHIRRLRPSKGLNDDLDEFFGRVSHLKEKLGVVLVQLPPSFGDDLKKLDNLALQVKLLEKKYQMRFPLAIEFRHKGWFKDEVYKLLKRHNIANVIASGPGQWPQNTEITANFVYIRFHGRKKLYDYNYTPKELDSWVEFIKNKCRNCKAVYVYFNNDHHAYAVNNAKYLKTKLA